MDIYQLEYVLAVAQYQHFSNAANEICVSQSALSHQINKLEDELGVQLFKRTTRTVYLTPAGKEFVAYAKRIISEIRQSKQAMRQYATAEHGELLIGAIPTIGLLKLTSTIAAFQRMHPHLHIDIHEDFSGKLLEMLQNFEIDAALATLPEEKEIYGNIVFYPLINDQLVLTIPPNHPLAKKKTIDLAEAKGEKFIMMKPNNGLYDISIDACRKVGFEPIVMYQSSQVDTVLGLVSEEMGIALMTSRIAAALDKGTYTIVSLRDAPCRVTALAVLKQNHAAAAINAFRVFMLDHAAL